MLPFPLRGVRIALRFSRRSVRHSAKLVDTIAALAADLNSSERLLYASQFGCGGLESNQRRSAYETDLNPILPANFKEQPAQIMSRAGSAYLNISRPGALCQLSIKQELRNCDVLELDQVGTAVP